MLSRVPNGWTLRFLSMGGIFNDSSRRHNRDNMSVRIIIALRKRLCLIACLLAIFCGSGCQTFNMSDEKFRGQQKGRYDEDSTEGQIVEAFGDGLIRSFPQSR